jgi:hypothetical protein
MVSVTKMTTIFSDVSFVGCATVILLLRLRIHLLSRLLLLMVKLLE